MRRRIIRAVVIALVLVLAPVAYFVFTRFFIYRHGVDRVSAGLRSEETQLSPQAVDVFMKLDGRGMPWFVSRSLLWELAPAPVKMAEWHLRGAVWQFLLPLRLSRTQLLQLYAHYLPFEGGLGVVYGAQHYFGKTPGQLTTEEAVGLVAISRSPRANSPTRNPEKFRRTQAMLLAKYRATVDAER